MIDGIVEKQVRRHISPHIDSVKVSFSHVAKDVQRLDSFGKESRDLLQKWNQYFLSAISAMEKSHKQIQSHVQQHAVIMPGLGQEITQLHKVHTALYDTLRMQQDSLAKVTTDLGSLRDSMQKVVTVYNKHFITLHEIAKDQKVELKHLKSAIAELKSEVRRPLDGPVSPRTAPVMAQTVHESTEIHSHSPQSTMAAVAPVSTTNTIRSLASQLSVAERQILLILVGTDQKLSYKDLAVNYGRTPSTIKNTICRLKSKNIPLFEQTGSDGVKRYYLDENFRKLLTSARI